MRLAEVDATHRVAMAEQQGAHETEVEAKAEAAEAEAEITALHAAQAKVTARAAAKAVSAVKPTPPQNYE